MNRSVYEDRIRGVIFGHAIEDALGLGTEFLSKKQVAAYYPGGLDNLTRIVRDDHRSRWATGEWTDDTDQMLCILDSLLDLGELNIPDVAGRIYRWAVQGGRGIGRTVLAVISARGFCAQPHSASEGFWRSAGCQQAANGGIMRTSLLGLWQNDSPEAVRANAAAACRVTHFDPRCVASCVVLCLAIRSLLRKETGLDLLLEDLANIADEYDSRVREYLEKALQPDIAALSLDENGIGYTLKALAAGIWALIHPADYRDGILAVIHEGGDADTNAAIAGAVLGARFGFSGIPGEWVNGLLRGKELDSRVDRLIKML